MVENVMISVFGRWSPVGRLRYWLLDRYYNWTLRAGLIGLCLLLTVICTILLRDAELYNPMSIMKAYIPALAIVGLAGVIFVYRNLPLMPLMALIVSTALADGVGTGTGTKITFTFMFLALWTGIWLFRQLVVYRKIEIRAAGLNYLVLAFIAAVLCSFAWSNLYVDEAVRPFMESKTMPRLMNMAVMILSPLTMLMFANLIPSVNMLKKLVWWFIFIGAVVGVIWFLTNNVPRPLNGRGVISIWVSGLAIGQVFFNQSIRWYLKIALVGLVGIWGYINISLGFSWLSGWVPYLLIIGIIMALYSRKLLLVGLVVVAIYVGVNQASIDQSFSAESTESGETREAAWSEALKISGQHFFLGTGPTGYYFYYSTYGFKANLSHNNYIDIIAQLGVIGFTAFIAMWLAIGWMLLKMYRLVPSDNGFVHGLKVTCLAAWPVTMVLMMLGDWITPFPYTQGLAGLDFTIWCWMMPGMGLALLYLFEQQQSPLKSIVLFSRG